MIWNRDRLYDEVWQSPMTHLAARLGVSNTRLKQICVNADIPVPPQGYWNKLAAGKPVPTRPPLGPSKRGIEGAQFPGPSRPFEDPISNADREATAASVSSATVSSTLRKPHPLIAQLRDDVDYRLKHIGMIANGPMAEIVCSEKLSDTDLRRFRILDALFKQLSSRGWQLKLEATRHFAAVHDVGQIVFRLNERLRQEFIDTPPPVTHLERQIRHPKTQVFHRTGCLAFEITTYGLRVPSKWEDTESTRIEERLPEILLSFLLGKLVQQKAKQDEEARSKRMAEAVRHRETARIEREQDDARWNALVETAGAWRDARTAKLFVDELAARIENSDELIGEKPASEWLGWARRRIAETDPLTEGAMAALQRIVGKS